MNAVKWEDVEYTLEPVSDSRITALVSTLVHAYANGRVLLVRLRPNDPELFARASREDLQGTDRMLAAFLNAESVRTALSQLDLGSIDSIPPAYHQIGIFEFEGALTHALMSGGAYRGKVPEEEARDLARRFVEGCFGEHRLGVMVFAVSGAWTRWFHDVAWDGSFICFDRAGLNWTCLFYTDTD